jgi:hypothetical protein
MDIEKDLWYSKRYVLEQINQDYDAWDQAMTSIRDKWEYQLKLYNNQKKKSKKDKLWDTTVYNIHSALLARLYLSGVETTFDWTMVWNEHIVDNVNASFKQDMQTTEMELVKYQNLWDSLFFWIWIICKTWWDWNEKQTTFQNVDPRLWVPDPNWDYVRWKYRYIWFKQLLSKWELDSMWIYHKELRSVKSSSGWEDTAMDILIQDRQQEDVFNYDFWSWNNELFNVFSYFWQFWDKKAYIITWNDNKIILWYKILQPITKKEKKNNVNVPFPFEFSHYRPQRWLIVGRSVPDDTEDVQVAKAMIANLRFDKSKAELYPMYLYNTRLIKNKTDLDFWFNKL